MNRLKTLAAAAALSLFATLASAQTRTSDGVTSIHQDNALAGGVTAGDAPGFPITISASGTYRLTSNLVVPVGTDGIVVNPGLNVHLDLNGFQIVGPAVCAKAVHCQNWSGTAGVRSVHQASHLSVRNGRIRGFSASGVHGGTGDDGTASSVTVEDLQLNNNGVGVSASLLTARRITARNNVTGMRLWAGHVQDLLMAENNVAINVTESARIHSAMLQFNNLGLYLRGMVQTEGVFHYWNKVAADGGGQIDSNSIVVR